MIIREWKGRAKNEKETFKARHEADIQWPWWDDDDDSMGGVHREPEGNQEED